ncbi:MAG TPA: sterol desaturase family protein [Flavitalea sp.]|nr:sterol desaturase family protein [Flavitalea sp.]
MTIPDLSNPSLFLVTFLVLLAIINMRYFIVSGLFYFVFYFLKPEKWNSRKIGQKQYSRQQLRREMIWSVVNSVSFTITGMAIAWLWQNGYTKIYLDLNRYTILWLPVSLLISMMIDESYYYWIHRWMHTPAIFRKIHRIHHQSNITSPWTAFAFHPVEGLLLAIVLPLTLMIIPMHPVVILVQLSIMTITSVINHLDVEIYPANFHRHKIGRWLIGATHHSLHHKQFRYNFGLYFTFWDKWKKTESPRFDAEFESATRPVKV